MANIYLRAKLHERIIKLGRNVIKFVHEAVAEKLDREELKG